MPFETEISYKGNQTNSGQFVVVDKNLNHTHEISIGNLCKEEIEKEKEMVFGEVFRVLQSANIPEAYTIRIFRSLALLLEKGGYISTAESNIFPKCVIPNIKKSRTLVPDFGQLISPQKSKIKFMEENELAEIKKRIQEILSECQLKLAEISAVGESSKQKELDINVQLARSIELKVNAERDVSAIIQLFSDVSELKKRIDEILAIISSENNEIVQMHLEAKDKTTEINNFYLNFEILKSQLNDPEIGVEPLHSKIITIHENIKTTNESIRGSKEEILKDKIRAEEIVKETVVLKAKIEDQVDDSQRLKKEISKILDLVRDTGLANSFDRRRKRAQWSSGVALILVLLGVGLSMFTGYNIFLTSEGELLFSKITNDYVKVFLRLTLTSPGVFLAWFGAVQYSNERFVLEQYEFKTAAALAIENYTKLLKQNYPNQTEDIFRLNVELIKSVYKETSYSKKAEQTKFELNLPWGSKLKADINAEKIEPS